MYEFTTQLSTIAAISAAFIAIIGGLIANKVISLTAEKETAKQRCKQIDKELESIDAKITALFQWLDTSDAIDFVDSHIDELLQLKPLAEVYDKTNETSLSFEFLLPYWEQALVAIKKYMESLEAVKKGDLSSCDDFKKGLNEFQKSICQKVRPSYENGLILVKDLLAVRLVSNETEIYNEKCTELEKLLDEQTRLVNEEIFLSPKTNLVVDSKTKRGLAVFLSTTLLNVIMPIIFMIFNPTSSNGWYYTEIIVSVVLFVIGLSAMCWYIYYLFPKNGELQMEKKVKTKKEAKLSIGKNVAWVIMTSALIIAMFLFIDYFNLPSLIGVNTSSLNLDFWSLFISNVVVIALFLITFILFDKRKLSKEKMADYSGTVLLLDTYRECESYLNILNNVVVDKDDIIGANTKEMISTEPFANYNKVFELFSNGHIPLERYNAYAEIKRTYESFVFVCSVPNGISHKDKLYNEVTQQIISEKEKLELYRESLK